MKLFHSHPLVKETIAGGKAKARAVLINGMQADLCLVGDDEFVSALHYFTGSKEHNIQELEFKVKNKKIFSHNFKCFKINATFNQYV